MTVLARLWILGLFLLGAVGAVAGFVERFVVVAPAIRAWTAVAYFVGLIAIVTHYATRLIERERR